MSIYADTAYMEKKNMIVQEGDKDILANIGKTVLILTAFMFVIIIAANVLT